MTDLQSLENEMTAWRQDFHRHPEFGFEEQRTAGLVAERLRSFGLEVSEGVGGTGVVGTLRRGQSNRAIALRADMDALRITEDSSLAYASATPGTMHACGHDGHTAMLLGAAKVLAEEGGFDGTVHFIFQPAEEWGQGALAMLSDGLMERFAFDEIFGIHNMPGLAVGSFRTKPGAFMSAEDVFEITLKGSGGHASRPNWTREVLVAACATVMNLQTIVARRLDPTEASVVSVTELITDGTRSVLPGTARILGDCRSFDPQVSAQIEAEMRRIVRGTAEAYGLEAELSYSRDFVPTVNDPQLAQEALAVARDLFGDDQAIMQSQPGAGSEDFARFLERAPGCFVYLGNGLDSKPLHHPSYDFNDAGLVAGLRFHVAIARRRLSPLIQP